MLSHPVVEIEEVVTQELELTCNNRYDSLFLQFTEMMTKLIIFALHILFAGYGHAV